jgi:hypothetical protein
VGVEFKITKPSGTGMQRDRAVMTSFNTCEMGWAGVALIEEQLYAGVGDIVSVFALT